MQKVHPGAVLLGLHSKAPLIPLVFYGAEGYRNNLIRLRRTDFRMKVGRQFTLDAGGAKVTKKVRQLMIDEVMYQLALQLPPVYRGYYSEISKASQNYLRFERINRI